MQLSLARSRMLLAGEKSRGGDAIPKDALPALNSKALSAAYPEWGALAFCTDQEYRKSVYKQCLDIILDWAVEIPIYQRQNCVIYSPERINADTFTKDVTTFYPWYGDIINIEMN